MLSRVFKFAIKSPSFAAKMYIFPSLNILEIVSVIWHKAHIQSKWMNFKCFLSKSRLNCISLRLILTVHMKKSVWLDRDNYQTALKWFSGRFHNDFVSNSFGNHLWSDSHFFDTLSVQTIFLTMKLAFFFEKVNQGLNDDICESHDIHFSSAFD